MDLMILAVPGCPGAAVLRERLGAVLADRKGISVACRVIGDQEEAVQAGMLGSPTLLVDGVDPFAQPGMLPSISCRIYRDGDSHGRVPTEAALASVLDQPGGSGMPSGVCG